MVTLCYAKNRTSFHRQDVYHEDDDRAPHGPGEVRRGSGLASCFLPFSLDNPAHRRIVESDMRCNFRLGITMLQMSLGDCQVPFRCRCLFRQETIKRRPNCKSLSARDLGNGRFLL